MNKNVAITTLTRHGQMLCRVADRVAQLAGIAYPPLDTERSRLAYILKAHLFTRCLSQALSDSHYYAQLSAQSLREEGGQHA